MKTTNSTAGSTSGLVVVSPAPGTASVASSLPSATPRELSVQSERPGSGAQSVPLGQSSAQSATPPSEAGETVQSAKSRAKKRAKEPGVGDEIQAASKRQKGSPKPTEPSPPEEGNPIEDGTKKKRPAPRPKPKGKKAAVPQSETATIPEQSAASTSSAPVEPVAASSEGVDRAPPRRSARITTGKASSSGNP